jgi:hypothetical protein
VWEHYWDPPSAQALAAAMPEVPPASLVLPFRARLVYSNDGDTLLEYTLTPLAGGQPGPNGAWPEVTYHAPDGSKVSLGHGVTRDGARVYAFADLPLVPAAAWAGFVLAWSDLNVGAWQNARAALAVERNRRLLDAEVDTSREFIFRTATIEAPNAVIPLNQFAQVLDISTLGATFADALQAAFTTLFGLSASGQRVTVAVSFGYELVPANNVADALAAYLPVALYPNQTLDAQTAGRISAAAERWLADIRPSRTGAEWAVALTLYSQLLDEQRSLLALERLVYRWS